MPRAVQDAELSIENKSGKLSEATLNQEAGWGAAFSVAPDGAGASGEGPAPSDQGTCQVAESDEERIGGGAN
eukprot:9418313-Pyramimonas_sp.AAC.1